MHKAHSLFYLTTSLHVSDVTITHLQEHKTTVTTASGNRYTVIDRDMLKSATTWKQKQINMSPTTQSNQFPLFQDSSRQQYGYVHHSLFYRTYCIFRRIQGAIKKFRDWFFYSAVCILRDTPCLQGGVLELPLSLGQGMVPAHLSILCELRSKRVVYLRLVIFSAAEGMALVCGNKQGAGNRVR
jgi:hypothetical protein